MTCWLCDRSPLVEGLGPNKWVCMKCQVIYYSCERCEQSEDRVCYDWSDEDKGVWCRLCARHFCIGCWQHTGTLTDDDEYTCEKCESARKNETENKK